MDYQIAHILDRFSAHHDGFEDPLRAYVGASEALFAVVVLALLLLVPGVRRSLARRAAVAAVAAAGAAVLIAHFVSSAVDRPRPFVAHAATIHPFLTHAADPSFPSDHATAAFAIATAVALRLRVPGLVLLAFATLLACGRVFLGLHYPSDVLAGAVLGAGAALAMWLPAVRSKTDRAADALGRALDTGLRRLSPG